MSDRDSLSINVPAVTRGRAISLSERWRFLRACYDYRSASVDTVEGSSGPAFTPGLRNGDMILVQSTHENGWADGTVLRGPTRGWIPTNYCEPYDHPFIRNVLQATIQLWGFVTQDGNKQFSSARQAHLQGLIAGVRSLLDQARCLRNTDHFVVENIGIRRARKSLLSELSSFKYYHDSLAQAVDGEQLPTEAESVDLYLANVGVVVTKAVRFLDLWLECMNIANEAGYIDPITEESTGGRKSMYATTMPRIHKRDSRLSNTRSSTQDGYSDAAGPGSPFAPVSPVSPISPDSPITPVSPVSSMEPSGRKPSLTLSMHSDCNPTEPTSQRKLSRSSLRISTNLSSPDLESKDYQPEAISPSQLASERLVLAHDEFLDNIGAFIGLHVQSRASLDLTQCTQAAIRSCAILVDILRAVAEQASTEPEDLRSTLHDLESRQTELNTATENLLQEAAPDQKEGLAEPDDGLILVAAATSCIRRAAECVQKAKKTIQTDGDFVLDLPLRADGYKFAVPLVPRDTSEQYLFPPIKTGRSASLDIRSRTQKPLITLRSDSVPSDHMPSPNPNAPRLQHRPSKRWSTPVSSDWMFNPSSGLTSARYSARNSIVSNRNSIVSARNSVASVSSVDTRITTPDVSAHKRGDSDSLPRNECKALETPVEECEAEAEGSNPTYSSELMLGREGQIIGGTLRALVEKVTRQHVERDAFLVKTFFLTFRLFTNASDLAEILVSNFEQTLKATHQSVPIHILGFIKEWLEVHWQHDSDAPALETLKPFIESLAERRLSLPGHDLCQLVSRVSNPKASKLLGVKVEIEDVRKTNMLRKEKVSGVPATISKSQLALLHRHREKMTVCQITDFDPAEIARQLTIANMEIFCSIQPSELLALQWTKKNGKAPNIKAMSRMSTDTANLVADTILKTTDVKKRAAMVKHWIKIAKFCFGLNNFDTLMAIMCTLTSSTISRLKRTWPLVSENSMKTMMELKKVVEIRRNYSALRKHIFAANLPCLPFVGIYLTDLTFIDAGNSNHRKMPNPNIEGEQMTVINIDKHKRTTKIISQLQRFQSPYQVTPVMEMQDWLQEELTRVRKAYEDQDPHALHQMSLELEPRQRSHDERTEREPSIKSNSSFTFFGSRKTSKSSAMSDDGPTDTGKERMLLSATRSGLDLRSKFKAPFSSTTSLISPTTAAH